MFRDEDPVYIDVDNPSAYAIKSFMPDRGAHDIRIYARGDEENKPLLTRNPYALERLIASKFTQANSELSLFHDDDFTKTFIIKFVDSYIKSLEAGEMPPNEYLENLSMKLL